MRDQQLPILPKFHTEEQFFASASLRLSRTPAELTV